MSHFRQIVSRPYRNPQKNFNPFPPSLSTTVVSIQNFSPLALPVSEIRGGGEDVPTQARTHTASSTVFRVGLRAGRKNDYGTFSACRCSAHPFRVFVRTCLFAVRFVVVWYSLFVQIFVAGENHFDLRAIVASLIKIRTWFSRFFVEVFLKVLRLFFRKVKDEDVRPSTWPVRQLS